MKTFTSAAVVGLAAAESASFVDFISTMAIQEAQAQEIEAEPQFSFQELLTQMHIDQIEEAESKEIMDMEEELASFES